MPSADSIERNIAISGRGGPQPAQKTRTATFRFDSNGNGYEVDPSTGLAIAGPPKQQLPSGVPMDLFSAGGPSGPTFQQAPPPLKLPAGGDQFVKPSAEDVALWLDKYLGAAAASSPYPSEYANNAGLAGDPVAIKHLQGVIDSSTSKNDLAKQLNVSPDQLESLFTATSQAATANSEIDSQVQAMKTRLDAQSSPPVQGGSTPDSIDRGAPAIGDPFALATAAPMNSTELQQLLLGLHAQDANEAPAKLEAAKQRILDDALATQQRTDQINQAYQAGLAGKPSPLSAALPVPGEPTTQSQYSVAGPQRAAVADIINPTGSLDTSHADEAILQAAGLVEQKRKAEAQYQLTAEITDQAQAQAAAESEIAATQKAAAKKAAADANKQQQANYDRLAERDLANQKAAEAIASAKQDDPAAQEKFDMLTRRFTAGARTQDAIAQVFDGQTSDMLTVPQMRLVQLAKVLAGGGIPPELKSEFDQHVADDRAARAEYFASQQGGN